MGKIDPFEKFLLKQKRTVDQDARRKDYVVEVGKFLRQVKGWLAPYEKKGLLRVHDKGRVRLTATPVEQYEAPFMRIQIGDTYVLLQPMGAAVVGALGRMDLRGTKGEAMLVLNEKREWEFLDMTASGVIRSEVDKKGFIDALQSLA